jgi:hypothetical protein
MEKFERIIDHLDTIIMDRIHKKQYRSMSDIDIEQIINEGFEKICGRKPSFEENDKIYDSAEFYEIIKEAEEYFDYHEAARRRKGHFEDFTHDNPFGSKGGFRYDKQ